MNEPERLISNGDDFEQALLRAGVSDGPSEASRRKVGGGLGIASAPRSVARASRWFKWVGGTAIVLAVGGAARLVHVEHPSSAPARTAAAAIAAAPPIASSAEPDPPVPTIVAEVASVPAVDPPIATTAAKTARAAPSASSKKRLASTLDAEMAALDGARAALRGGDAQGSLRRLDDYDAQFPSGILVPEATVLRIDALVHAGDTARARTLGQAFLRAHGESPLTERVRTLTNL